MPQNLIECGEQVHLMPVSLKGCCQGDLAWFILDAVEATDISRFSLNTRQTVGVVAYDPQMMVSLLLYACCVGMPSSWQVEQAWKVGIGFRAISANQRLDYSTFCHFSSRNGTAGPCHNRRLFRRGCQ